jgi:hypothetical protein
MPVVLFFFSKSRSKRKKYKGLREELERNNRFQMQRYQRQRNSGRA